ncbi:MAG: hypothetical protein RR419_06520 [Akkermansia sp.]
MFLKRIDETIQAGNFDLVKEDIQQVYLVEPFWDTESPTTGEQPTSELIQEEEELTAPPTTSKQPNIVLHWKVIGNNIPVATHLLFYDDTPDGSNTYFTSWQKFYAERLKWDNAPYAGCSALFSEGSPNFGGIAKATIYLRYSQGFIDWLQEFDKPAAQKITEEISTFEYLFTQKGNTDTKRLPTKWNDFKARKNEWALPCVCTLSDGKYLVLFLREQSSGDYSELEESGINVSRSLELMRLFQLPTHSSNEIISEEFQMASGMGRNAFGQSDRSTTSEYGRLLGDENQASRAQILDVLTHKLEYRIKVSPNPDSSFLLFLPEGDLKYSELEKFVNHENDTRKLYIEEKKAKAKKTEDSQPLIAQRPALIPGADRSTLFLANIEGSQKKKCVIQQIFPSISLDYLSCLNSFLLQNNIQYTLIGYMKQCLTAQDSDTPSVYLFWTYVFTSALQKHFICANEVFHQFQRFSKSFSGDELIEKGKARSYFRVIGDLLRLQHLIATAKTHPEKLQSPEFQLELDQIKQFNNITTGIFGTMNTTPPSGESLIGDVYQILRDKQRQKFDSFIHQAVPAVPDKDFPVFAKGAMVGILLNELTWIVNDEGRRFSATQGRHPSRLRGVELTKIFDKGMGLLLNLDAKNRFNCEMLPFIKSVETISRKDSFNSGLIMGLVYLQKNATLKTLENNESL